ncbi:MAG: DUF2147 domain-containing protein [Asticcacaulis sp.]|uniref:DUF2147 domain-containing protein n=1 Tax=Asticcacaulis sp. TaxID=1872648 RepID=UPI0039E69B0E
MRALSCLVFVIGLALPATGQAAELSGTWQRARGNIRIAFAPCNPGFCGKIVWLDPAVKTKAHIGDRLFYDLKADPQGWKGKSFSPQEGKTYSVTLTFKGAVLESRECMLGDRICRTESWARIN